MEAWNQLVDRNPNTKAEPVKVELPIHFLLNSRFSGLVKEDLAKYGTNWEKRDVREGMYQTLPDLGGLYLFVWRPVPGLIKTDFGSFDFPTVLYAGKAEISLRNRYKSEYEKHVEEATLEAFWTGTAENEKRIEKLRRFFSLKPLEFWFTVIEERSHIPNLEARLITLLSPPANQQKKLKAAVAATPIWRS